MGGFEAEQTVETPAGIHDVVHEVRFALPFGLPFAHVLITEVVERLRIFVLQNHETTVHAVFECVLRGAGLAFGRDGSSGAGAVPAG